MTQDATQADQDTLNAVDDPEILLADYAESHHIHGPNGHTVIVAAAALYLGAKLEALTETTEDLAGWVRALEAADYTQQLDSIDDTLRRSNDRRRDLTDALDSVVKAVDHLAAKTERR